MVFNEQKIYIRLLEGAETWVPVTAKLKDFNIFLIIQNPYLDLEGDVSSIWEYFPGDLVECEEKQGEFFAKKLLESTFVNRKLHQLIFKIVESLGKIKKENLQEFQDEILDLCFNYSIVQRRHPVVKLWLQENCVFFP